MPCELVGDASCSPVTPSPSAPLLPGRRTPSHPQMTTVMACWTPLPKSCTGCFATARPLEVSQPWPPTTTASLVRGVWHLPTSRHFPQRLHSLRAGSKQAQSMAQSTRDYGYCIIQNRAITSQDTLAFVDLLFMAYNKNPEHTQQQHTAPGLPDDGLAVV